MLESEPEDVFLNYALAKAYVAEGDVESGLERFDRVISLDSNYVAAYFQKGQVLADRGDLEAARDIVGRGLEVAQRTGDAHAHREMTEFLASL